jgi:hypothetical protein
MRLIGARRITRSYQMRDTIALGFLVLGWMLWAGGAQAGEMCGLCRCLEEKTRTEVLRQARPDRGATELQLFSQSRNCIMPITGMHFEVDAVSRTQIRRCFANQKTIAGTIEMYQLDKKVNCSHAIAEAFQKQMPGEPRVALVTDAFFKELVREGYLQSIPGDAPFHTVQYVMCNFGNGIMCLHHGEIQGPDHTHARDNLVQRKVHDPVILELAAAERPVARGIFHCGECMFDQLTVLLLLLDVYMAGSVLYLLMVPLLFFLVMLLMPFSTGILGIILLSRFLTQRPSKKPN